MLMCCVLSHPSPLPQRNTVPKEYKMRAMIRQLPTIPEGEKVGKAIVPDRETVGWCDWLRMSTVGKSEDLCRENCLGPLPFEDMEFAHDLAICIQTRNGRQFSFCTNAYNQSYTLSFTLSHKAILDQGIQALFMTVVTFANIVTPYVTNRCSRTNGTNVCLRRRGTNVGSRRCTTRCRVTKQAKATPT